jgi:hypothetical protein
MKPIHACSCVRKSRRKKAGTAVCFVLDSAHANHTIRTFLRDQAPGAVVRPISVEEAWRLIEIGPPAGSGQVNTSSKRDDGAR